MQMQSHTSSATNEFPLFKVDDIPAQSRDSRIHYCVVYMDKKSDGIASLGRIRWCNVLAVSRVLVICKLDNQNFVKRVVLRVDYIAQ